MTSRLLTLCLVLCCVSASRKPVAVTQGDGAKALLTGIKQTAVPTLPKIVLPTKPAAVYYFAVTATATNGIESDYSSEVSFTNTDKATAYKLGWYASPNAARYAIYKGRSSRDYTNYYPAGTKLSLTVPLPTPMPSNLVVTVSGSVNWTATNPLGMLLFTGKNLTISKRYQ